MDGRIAILTPDPGSPLFASRWRDVFGALAAALREAAFEVEGRPWTNGADLADFDLVLPLVAWGYHEAGDAWLRTLDGWGDSSFKVANPLNVLRWNADKSYLADLERRSAPTVPTVFVEAVTPAVAAEAAERFGVERLVLKPQVSAGAWRTIRWTPGEPLDGGPEGPAMIQPYLPEIETAGEVSLIYFGGAFSHAIRKRPQPGDFRVQPEHRGIIAADSPTPDEFDAAQTILAAVGEPLLYARVDLVRGLDGAPALIELELVEPDLYIGYDPQAPRKFADAVRELIGR